MKRNSGFTLIELLVVITIIGILAGLSFPAVTAALEMAKKTEANAMVNQLKIAMTSYQSEYGVWPSIFTGADAQLDSSNAVLYNTLNGTDPTHNPRRIVFMEFNSKALRAGAPSATNNAPPATLADADAFADPWNGVYYIQVDSDYNNDIVVSTLDGSGGTINASIAIWSKGKDNIYQDRDPKSW